MQKQVNRGSLTTRYSVRGAVLGYEITLEHTGLHEVKILSAREAYDLERKVDAQISNWHEKWDRVVQRKQVEQAKAASKAEAERLTKVACNNLTATSSILIEACKTTKIDIFASKFRKDKFSKKPVATENIKYSTDGYPVEVIPYPQPVKPALLNTDIKPTLTFFDRLFASRRLEKIKNAEEQTRTAILNNDLSLRNWNQACATIADKNIQLTAVLEDQRQKWQTEKEEFDKTIQEHNQNIHQQKDRYLSADPTAVTEYIETVLNTSEYPDFCPQTSRFEYDSDNKSLVIDYSLPAPSMFPTLQEVKYVASKNELKYVHVSEAAKNKLIDNTYYNIAIRTIYELYATDHVSALDAIAFNGWVTATDVATGNDITACILSLFTKKSDFSEIQIDKIEGKACFKKLKGIGSSKLCAIIPIQPIATINREDSRFIQGNDIAHTIDESTNLAAMDWNDFEHLIRELFEKEFSSNGGEVRITQASRDRGVDAIAFDPDPIRGGKIVIQAKRYTNTVDVACVRDLYGTVLNEGATKGILVTTADYGPDAYEFSKNKPITLLTGGNLLSLLEKHGHKAHIDIKEARLILAQEK